MESSLDIFRKHLFEAEKGEPLKYGDPALKRGAFIGDTSWKIADVTPKAVVVFMSSDVETGSRFAGKKYTFRWDGTGYKRQGQYIYATGLFTP